MVNVDLESKEEAPTIPFTKFFSYIKTSDQVLLVVGIVAAVCAGGILPSISLVMGNVAAAFSGNSNVDPNGNTNIVAVISEIGAIVSLIALGLFLCSYMFYSFWSHLAANISKELRKRYIAALMQQEVAYFEINKVE